MKKILYSTYTKVLIYLLCSFCFLQAFTTGLSGIIEYDQYKSELYHFEEDFESSYFLSNVIANTTYELYVKTAKYIFDSSFDIKSYFENNMDSNHMDYQLVIDDLVVGNMNNQQSTHQYYYKLVVQNQQISVHEVKPENCYIGITPSQFEDRYVSIYIGLKDSYIKVCKDLWNEQKQLVNGTIKEVINWSFAVLVSIIYLLLVSGKDKKGNTNRLWIDYLFTEANLLITTIFIAVGISVFVACLHQYMGGYLNVELFILYSQLIAVLCFNILLNCLLSIVRNIKNKIFLNSWCSYVVIKKVFQLIKVIFRKIINMIMNLKKLTCNYTSIFVVIILFIYTAMIGFLGICTYDSVIYLVLGVILFVVLAGVVLFYLSDIDQIKKGVSKMQKDETIVNIGNVFFEDMKQLKTGITNIALGLQDSINNALKAERMKTELITNVSHDLKTPLTSIINYTKLLSKLDHLPEEAKDYIAIIDKKSERLKTLTQDLFDISKVQSGNEQVIIEELDVETLVSQSLVECESELSKFVICTNIEDNLTIHSDGKKMSRVFNNLLMNISKYALEHTRVFITAYSNDHEVLIEFKNISSYPLDFDKDEIMQRFKRGDESRSEEGHGLGLAIVKSYVEVTGGIFDIVLDGDMFKAILKYNR